MTHTNPQLRKVAILVASLDAEWGQQILGGLTSEEIASVERAIDNLGTIDPQELRATLEEFRNQSMPSRSEEDDGVELDESLLAMISRETGRIKEEMQQPSPASSLKELASLNDVEPTEIVELLANEHPQTIAVVLSRLSDKLASEVLGQLSVSLQAEVLVRLTELDETDELSLSVVEEQVAQWIREQRKRQERMAAGREIVSRILEHTPPLERGVLVARIRRQNPELADRLEPEQLNSPIRQSPPSFSHKLPMNRSDSDAMLERAGSEVEAPTSWENQREIPTRGRQQVAQSRGRAMNSELDEVDYVAQLERLENDALLTALTRTEAEVVTLALAGASEFLLKRVVRHLSRRDAKAFRKNLKNIGPTRLADMIAAQRELLRAAT